MSSLLVFNFGTFRETNRFKQRALAGAFLSDDLMAPHSAGELVTPSGVLQVRAEGVETYSSYGLSAAVWKSKLSEDRPFKTAFQEWLDRIPVRPAHCVYLTGHHWSHETEARLILSWGEDTNHFHMSADSDQLTLAFGTARDRVTIASANLRASCRLVVGFGCNVASGINSVRYRSFFGESSPPVLLGWVGSINVPRARAQSVNERFFDYLLVRLPELPNAPSEDRLEWFYQNHPMELVRAWGYATLNWRTSQARARDPQGVFYRFQAASKKGTAEPVAA